MSEVEYQDPRKIWLVEHPITQYNEDVKLLARRFNLKILDPKHVEVDEEFLALDAPVLTKKSSKELKEETLAKKQKMVKKESK